MNRSLFFAAGIMAVSGFAQTTTYMRGVNISGAEFGSNSENPPAANLPGFYGSTYTYQSAPTFDYFAARGLPFLRVEVLWERLQPTPGGPLALGNPNDNLGYLKQDVAWAKAAGAQISIVLQNYGRYTLNGNICIIDNPCAGGVVQVTGADLADFWAKLAAVFVDEPAVVAYDMMNEPHDMGVANWNTISQQVVNAIRTVDSKKLIMVPGDSWSNATNWASDNGATGWISDPAGNFWYEGHEYFDHDYSGSYQWTYDQELSANADLANIGPTRLAPFVQWCTTNDVKCYVGEYGIPNDGPAADSVVPDARWLTVLDNFLTALDAAGLPGTYWAAGEFWGDYPLSIQPLASFTTDREQLQTLLNHLPSNLLRTTSAAASYGYNIAPNSLVAAYGTNLATGTPQSAPTVPLPTILGETQVQVTDSAGTQTFAPLLYVSGRQINYVIPTGVAPGLASVSVLNNGTSLSSGILQIAPVAPGLFTQNGTGSGIAAAYIQPVTPEGVFLPQQLAATYDMAQQLWVPNPISFDGNNLVLILYGTGFDQGTTAGTSAYINNSQVVVNYSGVSADVGEDQINVQLPPSLAGAGLVNVQAFVNNIPTNTVTLLFQ